MPYQPNIPQPNDALSISQGDLLGNFQTLNSAFVQNHTDLNSGIPGLHDFIKMPQTTPVGADRITSATQTALYTNVGVTSGVSELFFQRQGLAANSGYAITEATLASLGWTRLPSGLIMKWGTLTGTFNVGTWYTTTFTVGPVFAAIYNVTLQAGSNTVANFSQTLNFLTVGSITINNFVWTPTTAAVSPVASRVVYFTAIGR